MTCLLKIYEHKMRSYKIANTFLLTTEEKLKFLKLKPSFKIKTSKKNLHLK